MGRAGSCFDNAAAEWFFSTLEWELFRKETLRHQATARREVARFIDWYNRIRRHSSCEMKPPVEFEAILATRAAETVPRRGGGMKTGLHDRLTGSQRHRVAPDTGPMTSSSNNQQPSTIRGEAQRHYRTSVRA